MLHNRSIHPLDWIILLLIGLFALIWLLMVTSTPLAGTTPGDEWRSGGPYLPDSTTMTPTVVLDVEQSPIFSSDHTLFAASQSGLFRTLNGGESWQLVLALPQSSANFSFSHVRLSPAYATDRIVIAAYADRQGGTGTLYQSTDAGTTWQPLKSFTQTVTALALSPSFAQDQTIFTLQGDGLELYKSTDSGLTWQHYRLGAEEAFNGFNIVVSPNYATDQTLFATGFGTVQRSTDGGKTWSALSTYGVTYGLAISPHFTHDQSLWATYRFIEGPGDGTPESSVMRSFDGGNNWLRTAIGLPGNYEPFVRLVAVSPNYASDSSLFTALSGQLLGAPTHALFRSYNQGASWVDLGATSGNPNIYDIAVTSTITEGIVAHVATEQGVWHFQAACEQRIVNSGFEYPSGWHFPTTVYSADYTTTDKHSGAYSARVGIPTIADNRFAYSSAQQTVKIPSDAVSTTLTLWWNAFSGEGDLPSSEVVASNVAQAVAAGNQPTEALAGDRQYLLVLSEQGDVLEQLLWTRKQIGEWQPLTFDLSHYAGKTVRLHFGVYNDGLNGVTSMFVDDVTLTLCRSATTNECHLYLPLICNQIEITPTVTPIWTDPPTAIELFSPLANEIYRSPMDVNGFSRTFEGNVYLRLYDKDGNLIGQHRSRGGMTDFDFFHSYLRFEVTQETTATLEVYEAAAADQPPFGRVRVPIILQPGQRFVDLNTPTPGSKVCGRVLVAGYSNTFEANVAVELTERNGDLLEHGNTMGGAWGIYAEFATDFDYTVPNPRSALVGAYEVSPRNGELVDHVRIPVSLYPAGDEKCQE